MLKIEPRTLAYAVTLLGAINLACGSTPVEGSATGTDSSTGSTASSTSAVSNTNTPTTTDGSASNSATDSTVSGNSNSASDSTIADVTTDPLTGTGTGTTTTTGVVDTSDTGTGTSTSTTTGDTTTTGTTGTSTSTTGDTTTTGTSTTGDSTTGDPVECGLQLKATIRDIKLGHPDFETYCCGLVTGLVKPDLGADKKPVFNQVGNPKMLTDAPSFNQWYNNTNGVNMATQIILDLQEIMPGVYSYQNNAFFPVDNMLFGNEGNAHNYHFTTVPDTS